jgi:mono/diheme cytochrome c family protein
MRTANFALILLAVGALAGCASGSRPSGASAVERGHYLARIMDCTGCHTPGALVGRPDTDRYLAGADVGFGTPLGIVYPPNLTPDPVTGLGRWTDAEIARAIRQGVRPDGRALVPVMPWPSYSALTEADVAALVAYLRTLPPTRNQTPRNTPPGQPAPAPYLSVTTPR